MSLSHVPVEFMNLAKLITSLQSFRSLDFQNYEMRCTAVFGNLKVVPVPCQKQGMKSLQWRLIGIEQRPSTKREGERLKVFKIVAEGDVVTERCLYMIICKCCIINLINCNMLYMIVYSLV